MSSQQKLVLFSTPYRSQRLYLRLASSQHFNDSAPLSPPAPAAASTGSSGTSGTVRIVTNSKEGGGGLQARRRRRRRLQEIEQLHPAELLEHHAAPTLGMDAVLAQSGANLLQHIVRKLLTIPVVAGDAEEVPAQRRLSSSPAAPLPAALLQALGIASVQPA